MQQPIDKTLLRLYVEGRCSPEQLAVIRQYLNDPAYRESLEEWLQMDWQEVSEETFREEAGATEKYQQFLALVQPPVSPLVETTPVRHISSRRWWQVAAAAMIIGVMGWAGWQWQENSRQQQQVLQEDQWVHLQNEAGKRTEILLPDSSQVYLGAASSLRYNKNYGITNRDIVLEGEAYFIAKHKGRYPFSVRTGSITTVDIGTAFNIRYRSSEPAIKVAVAEGLVNVVNHDQPQAGVIASLKKQQQLNFDTFTRQAIVHTLPDGERIGSWRQGVLVFRKQRLREVAAELERYYGISIRFEKPQTADLLITTTINNASVKEAMDIVSLTAGVQINNSGKEVLIK